MPTDIAKTSSSSYPHTYHFPYLSHNLAADHATSNSDTDVNRASRFHTMSTPTYTVPAVSDEQLTFLAVSLKGNHLRDPPPNHPHLQVIRALPASTGSVWQQISRHVVVEAQESWASTADLDADMVEVLKSAVLADDLYVSYRVFGAFLKLTCKHKAGLMKPDRSSRSSVSWVKSKLEDAELCVSEARAGSVGNTGMQNALLRDVIRELEGVVDGGDWDSVVEDWRNLE